MKLDLLKSFELKKKKSVFGLAMSLLLLPLGGVSAHDVDPTGQLVKYSLFGKDLVQFGGVCGTASGGYLGSLTSVIIGGGGGGCDIRGPVMSAGSFTTAGSKYDKTNGARFSDTVAVEGSLAPGWATFDVKGATATTLTGSVSNNWSGTATQTPTTITHPTLRGSNYFPDGTHDVTSASDAPSSGAISPGTYKKLQVASATVTLSGGDYYFDTIVLNNGAKINIVKGSSEVTRIIIKTSISMIAGTQIIESAADYGKVVVYVDGTANVTLNSGTQIDATIYAPFASVKPSYDVIINGQILAKSIVTANKFNGADGSFVAFDPAGVKIAGASALALFEETVDSDYKTRKSSLITIPVTLSAATTEAASLNYTIRSAGTKYGSKESVVVGTDSNTSDIVHTNYGASAISGTLNYAINATNPTSPLKVWVVDDSLPELDAGDTSYIEIKLDSPVKLKFEIDPVAVHASVDSLVYKIPLISDDPANRTPVRDKELVDVTKNEDFTAFNITTRLDTLFSDPDGDALTYSLVSSSKNWGNVSVTSTTLSYGVVADSNGLDTVIVSATDGAFTTYDTVVVNVRAVNDAPSLVVNPTILSVQEDSSVDTLIITSTSMGPANESSQGVLNYNVTNVQKSSLFSVQPALANDGKLSFTLATNVVDSSWVYFRLQDDGGVARNGVDTSVVDSIWIKVINANDSPTVVSPIGDITLLEDFNDTLIIADLNTVFNDIDGDNLTFSVTFTNRVTSKTSSLGNDSLILQKIADEFGVDGKVVVTANDGTVSVSDTFLVDITPVNDEPGYTAGSNVTTSEEDVYSNSWATSISVGPANENVQTLSFVITNISDSSLFATQPALDANGTLSFTGAVNKTGTATVSYYLKDNGGTANNGIDTTATSTFTITLSNTNDNPEVDNPISDVTVLEDFASYIYVADLKTVFSDPDGDALNFSVNSLNSLVSATIDSDGIRLNSIANLNGQDTIVVTATDASSASISDTFLVNITPVNDEPGLTVGSNVNSNEEVNYNATWATNLTKGPTSDENSQTLSFVIDSVSNSSLFSTQPALSSSGVLTFVGATNQTGSATVYYYLKDNGGKANGGVDSITQASFTITLSNVNDDPVVSNAIKDTTVLEDFANKTYILDLNTVFSDPDGNTLSFSVSSLNSLTSTSIVSGNQLQLSSKADLNGSETLVVTANDGNSGIVSDTFVVSITPVNDQPDVTAKNIILNEAQSDSAVSISIANYLTINNYGPSNEVQSVNSVSFTLLSSGGVFAVNPTGDASQNLNFTLAANQYGVDTLEVVFEDNGGIANSGISKDTVQLIITVDPQPSSLKINGSITFSDLLEDFTGVVAYDTAGLQIEDPDGANLVMTAESVNGKVSVVFDPLTDSIRVVSILNENGTDSIKITVRDTTTGNVRVAIAYFPIEIIAVNDQPDVVGVDLTFTEAQSDSAISVSLTNYLTVNSMGATNESAQGLQSLAVSILSSGTLFSLDPSIDASNNLGFTIKAFESGQDTLQIIYQDNGGITNSGVDKDTLTLVVTVTDVSSAISITGDLVLANLLEDFAGTVSVDTAGLGVVDPDAGTLTMTALSLKGLVNVSVVDDSLRFTAISDANGTDSIRVTFTEGTRTVSKVFELVVTAVNDAPDYDAGSKVTVAEETVYSQTWATNLSKGPADESAQTLNFVIKSVSPSGLFSTQPALSSSGLLTFEAAKDSVGTATVYFELRDNGGVLNGGVDSVALDSFQIEILNSNDNPVLKNTVANLVVVEDTGLVSIERFDSLFTDPDGDLLTYTVVLSNGKALDSSSLDSIRMFTANDSNGLVTVTVTATDPSGLSVNTQFDLNILAANDAPTGINLSAKDVLENSAQGTLIGNLGTVDIDLADVFTYELIETSTYTANDFVQINGNKLEVKLKDSIDYEARTSFDIKVRTYDSDSAFVDSVFTINILNVNDAPYRNGEITDIVLNEDFSDSLVITQLDTLFIDPEGDDLTFTVVVLKNKVSESISSDSVSFKSILNEFGIDTLIITAEDIVGNKAYDTVLVTVNAVNDDIIVNDTTGTIKENVNDSTVVGVVTVIDVDGDSIIYNVDPKDSNYVIDEDGNIRLKDGVTLDYENSPLDTIQVIVSDGVSSDTISVVVSVQNEVEVSEVVITKAENDKNTWTTKLDTVWINTDSITMTYNEDGVISDSLVLINTTYVDNKTGVQEVIRIFHNETKDKADTVITYVVYSTKDPEIVIDTSKTVLPRDSNGVIYINSVDMTVDLLINEYGKDPYLQVSRDSSITGVKAEGQVKDWIVTYTDIYGNTVTDTIQVILDTTAPLVEITRPSDNYVLTNLFAQVDWQVEGVQMTVDTTETLVEGKNVIVRSFTDFAGNTGSDTITVRVILEGNKVSVTLSNEVLQFNTVSEDVFEDKVNTYYSERGRDKDEVQKESWNLSFKIPDDDTDQFTDDGFYIETFYNDGSKKVERDVDDQVGYSMSADKQIGASFNVQMQFPVLSNEFETDEEDAKGVCEDGEYMWELSVDQIKLTIYDQLGQFVRNELIEGFKIDPRFQDREGKVVGLVDLPSENGDMRASDGRKWAAGVYLIHTQIQTRAVGINCNEGENEVSRLGTMLKLGITRN